MCWALLFASRMRLDLNPWVRPARGTLPRSGSGPEGRGARLPLVVNHAPLRCLRPRRHLALEPRGQLQLRHLQVVARLEVQPEPRLHAEVASEPQRRIGRYAAQALHDLIDAPRRHARRLEPGCGIELQQLAPREPLQVVRQLSGKVALEKAPGFLVPKALNH